MSFGPRIFNPERSANLVQEGWATFRDSAFQAVEYTFDFIDEIRTTAIPSLEIPDVDVDLSSPQSTIDTLNIPNTDLTSPDLNFNLPTEPVAPVFGTVRPIEPGVVPQFIAQFPDINIPPTPEVRAFREPGDAPTIADLVLPDVPQFVLPDVPLLRELDLPDVPVLAEREFDESAPQLTANVPGQTLLYTEDVYTSELLEAYSTKLQDDIENGTLGLEDFVEQQFYDRLRNRDAEATTTQKQAVYDEFAARGFTQPPGALATRTSGVDDAAASRSSASAREVFINQAERAIQQYQFAVTSSIQSEGQLMNYTNSLQQRLFDLQRAVLQAGIDIYNAEIQGFNVEVSRFSVFAQIFQLRLQGDLQRIQQYRTQIDAQNAINQLNTQDIANYSAQISAINQVISLYATEVQARQTQVSIEQTRIQGFSASVTAFQSRVQAQVSEFQLYSEQIRGELTKVQVFASQTDAYKSEVDGYAALTNALTQQTQADIATNDSKIRLFTSRLDSFRAQLQAESSRIEAESRTFDATVRSFTAELSGEQSQQQASIAEFEAEVRLAQAQAGVEIQEAQANIESTLNRASILQAALATGASASQALASAALSAVSLSAGITESVTEGATYGWSGTFSENIDPIIITP